MNFDQLYPEASLGFEDKDGFIKGRYVLDCIVCSSTTSWFHRGKRLYFCSPACFRSYQPAVSDSSMGSPRLGGDSDSSR